MFVLLQHISKLWQFVNEMISLDFPKADFENFRAGIPYSSKCSKPFWAIGIANCSLNTTCFPWRHSNDVFWLDESREPIKWKFYAQSEHQYENLANNPGCTKSIKLQSSDRLFIIGLPVKINRQSQLIRWKKYYFRNVTF